MFTASNVEIITKRRVEHLLEEDKERFVWVLCRSRYLSFKMAFFNLFMLLPTPDFVFRCKQEENNDSLSKVLRLVEKTEEFTAEMKRTGNDVYCGLTPAQYLDEDFSMEDRDIGHPKQVIFLMI